MRAGPWLPLAGTFGDAPTAEIFSERTTVRSWLAVERELANAQASLGLIPREAALAISEMASSDSWPMADMADRTRIIGYPILPLLEAVADRAPANVADWIHLGATTQDVMDTALSIALVRCLDRSAELVMRLGDYLAELAIAHRTTVMAGRTHGQHAVPTTFGAKVAVWLAELARHLDRLKAARRRVRRLSLFGAAGTSAALGPRSREIRRIVAAALDLEATDLPWHTSRDCIAEWAFVLTGVANTCGKMATEIVSLARTEIGEVREAEAPLKGASSTMPQKSNPISSEVVIGFAGLANAHVTAITAATRVGHERAAGEWQIEWDAIPLLGTAVNGALINTVDVFGGLVVDGERMRTNLQITRGALMSEAAMIALAPRLGRMRAHQVVYEAAALGRASGLDLENALQTLLSSEDIAALGDLGDLLDPRHHLGEAEAIVNAAVAAWRGQIEGGAVEPRSTI
jgi:3-carboxy-cis,cis-muconate cycloisomerase